MKLSSRSILTGATVVICAVLLMACGAGAPAAAPSKPAAAGKPAASAQAGTDAWNQLVAAAKAEGTVVVYGGASGTLQDELLQSFERAFPGIKVQGTFLPAPELLSRLLAERTAGKYLPDVLTSLATGPVFATLKDAGALAPLESSLILPDAIDPAGWFEGHLWWTDDSPPRTTVMMQGSLQSTLTYNPKLVDPSQFTSYWDLLDPKWKGKIVATDVRKPGPGITTAVFLYSNPQVGPKFIERLFSEQSLTLSNDQRQMVDWIAQGRYPLGVFVNHRDVGVGMDTGLSVAVFAAEKFKEGAAIGPSAGTTDLVDRAPHPNAGKVYLNWLLSREGQATWQRGTKQNSLRIDIPKQDIFPFDVLKPGASYTNMGAEKFGRMGQDVVGKAIDEALQKAP